MKPSGSNHFFLMLYNFSRTVVINTNFKSAIRIILIVIIGGSCATSSGDRSEVIDLALKHQDFDGDADEQTLRSIQRVEGFYTVVYYGEYEERLNWLNEYHVKEAARRDPKTHCSLFAAYSNTGEPILGRNFDRLHETPVLGKFSAPGKYASFAFSPGSEVYLSGVADVKDPTEEQKNNFLVCLPFYPTDGINEKGLSIAIAGASPRRVNRSEKREPMFVLLFIRHALDNFQSVDEVAQFAETVSLYDSNIGTISHHFIVVDASGKWLVIDYPDGNLRLSYGQGEPQVRTNHFPEDGPAADSNSLLRYQRLYEALNTSKPPASDMEAMELLKQVRNETKWSVVYNSFSRNGLVVVHEKFQRKYRFEFSRDNQ